MSCHKEVNDVNNNYKISNEAEVVDTFKKANISTVAVNETINTNETNVEDSNNQLPTNDDETNPIKVCNITYSISRGMFKF